MVSFAAVGANRKFIVTRCWKWPLVLLLLSSGRSYSSRAELPFGNKIRDRPVHSDLGHPRRRTKEAAVHHPTSRTRQFEKPW